MRAARAPPRHGMQTAIRGMPFGAGERALAGVDGDGWSGVHPGVVKRAEHR